MTAHSRNDLIGVWRSDLTDNLGLQPTGRVTLDFRADNYLVHTIHGDTKDEIALLTYDQRCR